MYQSIGLNTSHKNVFIDHLWFTFSESLSTVTPDGIQSLSAPELRRRSAVIVNRLRLCIASCKTILVDKFQVND